MGPLSRRIELITRRSADAPQPPPFATVLSRVASSPFGLAVPQRDPDGAVAFAVAPERVVAPERLDAVRNVFAPEDGAADAWRRIAADATARSLRRAVTSEQLAATQPVPAATLNRAFRLAALPEVEVPDDYLPRTKVDRRGDLVLPTTPPRTVPAGLGLFTGGPATGTEPWRLTGSWTGPWDGKKGPGVSPRAAGGACAQAPSTRARSSPERGRAPSREPGATRSRATRAPSSPCSPAPGPPALSAERGAACTSAHGAARTCPPAASSPAPGTPRPTTARSGPTARVSGTGTPSPETRPGSGGRTATANSASSARAPARSRIPGSPVGSKNSSTPGTRPTDSPSTSSPAPACSAGSRTCCPPPPSSTPSPRT
ncbi:hypothetical protein ACFQ0G_38220 [Streptomyces chiangmaiensis]